MANKIETSSKNVKPRINLNHNIYVMLWCKFLLGLNLFCFTSLHFSFHIGLKFSNHFNINAVDKELTLCMIIFLPHISCFFKISYLILCNKIIIINRNWTEWSTIQVVIKPVISKLAKHEADLKLRARLLPELYSTQSNY